MPVVASGSKSSTTEVNAAASAAATMDQELSGTSRLLLTLRGGDGHSLEEELTEDSYPPSESADEEIMLDSPRGAAPDVSAPSSLAEATARGAAGTTGQKRETDARPTPPQVTKKNKKPKRGSSSRLVTFEQAEKENRHGVVLVQGNPYQILTKDQIAWLRTTLGNRVDAVIDSDAAIPRFTESGVRNGRFCLSCANGETFSWLVSLLGTLEGSDGQGGTLRYQLALPTDIPKLTRAKVHITGPPPGVRRFLKNLKAQNSTLHPERWALKHQQQATNYQSMVFGIDPESLASLEASDYHAFFRLGRVTFNV